MRNLKIEQQLDAAKRLREVNWVKEKYIVGNLCCICAQCLNKIYIHAFKMFQKREFSGSVV